MIKRYRALGVIAIVTLIAMACWFVLYLWYTALPPNPPQSDLPPFSRGGLLVAVAQVFLCYLLLILVGLPTVSIFSVVVARQSRQRTWFAIFLVVGCISWYVGGHLDLYPITMFLNPFYVSFLFQPVLIGVAPVLGTAIILIVQAVPSLLALTFVWLKAHATASTQGSARQPGQA